MNAPGMVAQIGLVDAEDWRCSVPPPPLFISVSKPLSADDLAQIARIAAQLPRGSLSSIEEVSAKKGRYEISPGAELVVSITVWGGYDRCLEVGWSRGCLLERVRGRWRRVPRSDFSIVM